MGHPQDDRSPYDKGQAAQEQRYRLIPSPKAFTKDDASDGPLIVPPRAPLPPGVPNYVTARGQAR